jgi:hypothetical protein
LLTHQILTTRLMQLTDKVTELQADLVRARGEHFRLVWLAGGTDAERSAVLSCIADAEDGVYVELGKKLSEALIEVPAPLRTASVEECFTSCLGGFSYPVTCLNHLEILFDPNLRINPVMLIKSASRHALIVAAWPGFTKDGQLTFGSPDHPAFMEPSKQDLESLVHFL